MQFRGSVNGGCHGLLPSGIYAGVRAFPDFRLSVSESKQHRSVSDPRTLPHIAKRGR